MYLSDACPHWFFERMIEEYTPECGIAEYAEFDAPDGQQAVTRLLQLQYIEVVDVSERHIF